MGKQLMICPNCNIEMKRGYCIRCGLMENGMYIKHGESKSKFDDIRLYNDDFDKIYRNNNWLFPFLAGPLYLSYRRHLLLGIICGVIDFIVMYYSISLYSLLCNNTLIIDIIILSLLFFIRLIYAIFSNTICIMLDKRKIKKIKLKYDNTYKEQLQKHKNSFINIIINILFYILIISIFVIIRRFENGTI